MINETQTEQPLKQVQLLIVLKNEFITHKSPKN